MIDIIFIKLKLAGVWTIQVKIFSLSCKVLRTPIWYSTDIIKVKGQYICNVFTNVCYCKPQGFSAVFCGYRWLCNILSNIALFVTPGIGIRCVMDIDINKAASRSAL